MRRGFTLLEVVLALSLAILLLGSMITFLWELADRRTTLARGTRDLHAGAVLLERLEADLTTGLAGDQGMGAGVKGTETTLKVISRGVWLTAEAEGGAGAHVGEGDLQATEFSFNPLTGTVSARRSVVSLVSASADEEGGSTGEMQAITDRVERLRFRYYDGKGWRTSFDSMATGTLPVAIEVAVWFTGLKNDVAPPQEVAGAMTEFDPTAMPEGDDEGDEDGAAASAAGSSVEGEKRWPAPDRLRVIIIPDGPVTAAKEGA